MSPKTKPYVKLATTLVVIGGGLMTIERLGLSNMSQSGGMHLDGTILSILVVVPVLLIISGCLVFMVGKMRRL